MLHKYSSTSLLNMFTILHKYRSTRLLNVLTMLHKYSSTSLLNVLTMLHKYHSTCLLNVPSPYMHEIASVTGRIKVICWTSLLVTHPTQWRYSWQQ